MPLSKDMFICFPRQNTLSFKDLYCYMLYVMSMKKMAVFKQPLELRLSPISKQVVNHNQYGAVALQLCLLNHCRTNVASAYSVLLYACLS